MNTHDYVEELFKDYENDKALADFKEEIESNLKDRIQYLKSKGMAQDEAEKKAADELGSISEIAGQISANKKKEVFEQMYMKIQNYISTKKMVLYVLLGLVVAFSIVIAVISYLYSGEPAAGWGTLIPFFILPVCVLTFMGLTQESATTYPLKSKRAIFYAVALFILLFGIDVFLIVLFEKQLSLANAIATLIPFALPAAAAFAFLMLTEKERRKPWVVEQEIKIMKEGSWYGNSKTAARRGLISGALWLFAISLFVTLGIIIGFKYSWMVFMFAIACEPLIEFFFTGFSGSK